MPTEPVAALLYVCLLLPGIAFIWNYEGHRPVIKRSAFRETAHVDIASAASLISVFFIHYILGFFFDPAREALQAFFIDPGSLFRADSQFFFGVLLGDLALAVAFGAFFGSESADRLRRRVRSKWRALCRKEQPVMDRGLSAWAALFDKGPKVDIHLGIQLKSGNWVQGKLLTYNGDGHDGPDRALTLRGELAYLKAGGKTLHDIPDSQLVIQASEIDYMTVGYQPAQLTLPAGTEGGAKPSFWRGLKKSNGH